MNYSNGEKVKVGDKVQLGEDKTGVVICSIDDNDYTDEAPEEQWAYLKKGVMIQFVEYGLIHYEEPEPDLKLISRG